MFCDHLQKIIITFFFKQLTKIDRINAQLNLSNAKLYKQRILVYMVSALK